MRGLSVALLALAGGCSLIVGDDQAAVDAGAEIDAELGALDAGDCPTSSKTLPVAEDTTLVQTSRDTAHDGDEVADIGVGVGMFKFFLDPTKVALSPGTVRRVRLDLPYAGVAISCTSTGTACASCDMRDAPGEARVYVMRSDWDGSTVTYDDRIKNEEAWESPGASGLADRSPLLDTEQHMDDADTSIDIDIANFAENFETWVLDDQLTFQVAVDGAT